MNYLNKTFCDRVLDLFDKAEQGSLLINLPDGSSRHFGVIDTPPEISMTVHDESFFRDLVLREDIGLGESYEAGKWGLR